MMIRLLTFFAGVLVLFQNCSQANFKTSAASLAYQSCTQQLGTTTMPIKVMFVVDTSGSNAGTGGSDPNKSVRGGSISQFFTSYRSRANFSWGFLYFSGSIASSLIGGTASPQFTSNPSLMQQAVSAFYGVADSGLTPYMAAINLARQAIQSDAPSAAANTKYVVVFLSDGLPDPVVDDATLRAGVQALLGVRPNQVSFNAIYYGEVNATANARLQMMASTGAGQFLDTNNNPTGKQFVISDVINVAGLNCGSAN